MRSGAEATLGVEVTLTTFATNLSAFSASGGCNNFKIENWKGRIFQFSNLQQRFCHLDSRKVVEMSRNCDADAGDI